MASCLLKKRLDGKYSDLLGCDSDGPLKMKLVQPSKHQEPTTLLLSSKKTQYPQHPQCQHCRNINSHKKDSIGATAYPVQISGSAHTVPSLALPSRDQFCSAESECALAS